MRVREIPAVEEEREGGGENDRRGGGAVFLAIQVLEIPAGGRGLPLVIDNLDLKSYYT